jgi:hypothetical protein
MGNSDAHSIISEIYERDANRPMTLVFAKERSHDSLKEAMFAGRTMVYFRDVLAGKEEYARPFFFQCITVGKPYYENERSVFIEVTNKSDIPFYLTNGTIPAPATLNIAANSVTRIVLPKTLKAPLKYDVRNIITGEKEVLRIELKY